jgi:hypothetical protein
MGNTQLISDATIGISCGRGGARNKSFRFGSEILLRIRVERSEAMKKILDLRATTNDLQIVVRLLTPVKLQIGIS